MREILFRGKRMGNGKWYFGSYLFIHVQNCDWTGARKGPAEDVHYIIDASDINIAVNPTTVGQYTGKCDKAGTRAFEHDCIQELNGDAIGVIRYGEYRNPFDDLSTCHIGFYVDWISGENKDVLRKDLGYWLNLVEIIGNIHDNPELLEGGDEK